MFIVLYSWEVYTMKDKSVMIIMSIICLFSLGCFIYHVITADKLIRLISILSFAVVIIIGIFVPLYTPTDVGENKLNGGNSNGKRNIHLARNS